MSNPTVAPVAVTIRTAREEDSASIALLATQLGYPASTEEIRKRLCRILQADADSAIVAELANGEVCGWILVVSTISLTSAPRAEVAGLVVDQAMRGLGIGARLLQAAMHWATINDFAEVRVHSNTIRERAHQFYEREGFKRIKTQVLFGKLT
ncbi:MAG: GNAT family N-acetyltransferase [Xanthomonadales bacterium]|nr:GNAT family N-acetyltransferase [Xanthomonadales bacterium]